MLPRGSRASLQSHRRTSPLGCRWPCINDGWTGDQASRCSPGGRIRRLQCNTARPQRVTNFPRLLLIDAFPIQNLADTADENLWIVTTVIMTLGQAHPRPIWYPFGDSILRWGRCSERPRPTSQMHLSAPSQWEAWDRCLGKFEHWVPGRNQLS